MRLRVIRNNLRTGGHLTSRLLSKAQNKRRIRNPNFLFRWVVENKSWGWIPRIWLSRTENIVKWLRFQTLRVHRGKKHRRLYIQKWNVGYPLGNFARTRKLAIFKKKASLKKKQRKKLALASVKTFEWDLQRIKDIRAGNKRRTPTLFNSSIQAQIRGIGL